MIKLYNYINVLQNDSILLNKNIIIWGKSVSALNLYVELKSKNVNVIGFTDSFTDQMNKFADLPLYPFREIQKMKDIAIYIATSNFKYRVEILEQIQNMGIPVLCKGTVYGPGLYDTEKMNKKMENERDKIEQIKDILSDEKSRKTFDNLVKYRVTNDFGLIREIFEEGHKQYFPPADILNPSTEEIFVDGGAYNGVTSLEFSKWVRGKYKKIYMMEPDKLMGSVAGEFIALMGIKNVETIRKGAYSESTILNFRNLADSASSCIDKNGESQIETITIDEMLNCGPATYIKMDIEGAELPALIGAEHTIKHYRPKLAISIYHKEDDLWNIPYYIHQKYPWYKLYIRHYTNITTETVLYASI